MIRDGLLATMSPDQGQSVITDQLDRHLQLLHAVAQPMLFASKGSIVNISSVAAEFGSRGQVNYAASKGGIDGLTRCLAKELASRKVRVNGVAPGMIETDMSSRCAIWPATALRRPFRCAESASRRRLPALSPSWLATMPAILPDKCSVPTEA